MHKIYIQRCLQLAGRFYAETRPNPSVGALWVWNDRILGEGVHKVCGGDHAEVNAFKDIDVKNHRYIKHSTLYVSLEPCYHQGKTPPCIELVLTYKPRRVVIAMKDPYPAVSGKSIRKLRREGIEVAEGILKEEAIELNLPFLITNKLGRPFIRLKFARDKNGIIGTKDQAVWITNPISKLMVHKLRSETAAILTGSGTVITDNPSLTNRYWAGPSPMRILLDFSKKLNTNYRVFNNDVPVWWLTGPTEDSVKISHADDASLDDTLDSDDPKNVSYLQKNAIQKYSKTEPEIPVDKEFPSHIIHKTFKKQEILLKQVISDCTKNKVNSILVEGGKFTLEQFLKAGLWDELYIFTSPLDISSMNYSNLVRQPDFLPTEPAIYSGHIRKDRLDIYRNPRTTKLLQKL